MTVWTISHAAGIGQEDRQHDVTGHAPTQHDDDQRDGEPDDRLTRLGQDDGADEEDESDARPPLRQPRPNPD